MIVVQVLWDRLPTEDEALPLLTEIADSLGFTHDLITNLPDYSNVQIDAGPDDWEAIKARFTPELLNATIVVARGSVDWTDYHLLHTCFTKQ